MAPAVTSPGKSQVKSPIKSALEYAFVAILGWGACLWFLVSEAQAGEVAPLHGVMLSLGLCVTIFAHWVYMGIAIKRGGRRVWPWALLMVLAFPIGSVIVGILLANQLEDGERDPRDKPAA